MWARSALDAAFLRVFLLLFLLLHADGQHVTLHFEPVTAVRNTSSQQAGRDAQLPLDDASTSK